MAAAPRRPLPERRWRRLMRWLGGPDSWRRIVVTGATAGLTLAFVAAMIVALVGRNGGSLNGDEPTVEPGVGGPVDGGPVDTVEPPPVEVPTEPAIEEPPTEVPTEVPIEEPPTDVPAEPTPTVPEKPPSEPTLAEGAGV